MNSISFQEALERLKNNEILIYPTETFYAVGGSSLSRKAVAAVYDAKERDKHFPLPVIIGDMSQLDMVAKNISSDALDLAKHFWPGPLTILFPAKSNLPRLVTGITNKVAVRLSSHPAACRLCLEAGFPIVSSSANLSGHRPAQKAEELNQKLMQGAKMALYDAPPVPAGGLPSTIIELVETRDGDRFIHILREGAIPVHKLDELGFACHVSD